MPKYIKKKDLKNAIDECTWYHIGKGGELVEGANSSEHEPLYKYSDIKKIIKNLPTRKFETEPKRTALSKALKWTYGDEPNSSEKPNICEWCKFSDGENCYSQEPCKVMLYLKDEPHIVGKHADAVIIDEARLTAKCLNCANGSSYKCSKCDGEMYYKYDKDVPQTDCAWK